MINIEKNNYKISFDEKTGSLTSFIEKLHNQEFLAFEVKRRPLFNLRFRTKDGDIWNCSSLDASKVSFEQEKLNENINLKFNFLKLKGEKINVQSNIICSDNEFLVQWFIEINNNSDKILEWVDYPNIEVPYKLEGSNDKEKILWPLSEGVILSDLLNTHIGSKERFINNATPPSYLQNDFPGFYPGFVTAQMLAFYNEKVGLYIAAYDGNGIPKHIEPLRTKNSISLTFIHYLGGQKKVKIDYPVVLGSFYGDWYDAAKIYRDWAYKQNWCKNTLFNREDIPKWWLDSPVPTLIPLRGTLDGDSAKVNPEYMPATNSILYLKELSEKIQSVIVPIITGWQKEGPWSEPNCFPPFGGEKHIKEFFSEIKKIKWHGGTYISGTRWTTKCLPTGYDSTEDFLKAGAMEIACFLPNGKPWAENWDSSWRRSYRLCIYNPKTIEIVIDQCKKLIDYGVDYLQMDQNIGGMAFFCYSKNHGHPEVPGKWLTEAMKRFLKNIQQLILKYKTEIIFGTEGPVAEVYIPYYSFADGRSDWLWWLGEAVPLYQFLYHEFIQINHGILWSFADPDTVLLKIGLTCIYGDALNIVLREKGKINRAHNIHWTQKLLDQDKITKLIINVNNLRKGIGKDYLIFGRMIKPFAIENVEKHKFKLEGTPVYNPNVMEFEVTRKIPLVLTSAWENRDGVKGQVIVNYSSKRQKPKVSIKGNGNVLIKIHNSSRKNIFKKQVKLPHKITVNLEPLEVALLEIY